MIRCAFDSDALGLLPLWPVLAHAPTPDQVRIIFLIFFGPFILAALLLAVAVIAWFWSRQAAVVCLLIAALSFAIGAGIWWNDQQPVRERHSRWAAAVAEDPEVLRGIDIGDEDLKLLDKTTRLRELELNYCSVSSEGLQRLANLKSLKRLSLQGALPSLGRELDAAWLIGLNHLESLNLACNYSVTDAFLKSLEDFQRLRTLNLQVTPVTDAGLDCLKGLTELQDLDLGGTKVTGPGLAKLEGLEKLEKLNLARIKEIRAENVDSLKALPHLRDLSLEEVTLNEAVLARLAELKHLQRLSLDRTKTGDAGLALIKPLSGLQELGLCGTEITDEGLSHLAALASLQELWLAYTRVTDDGLPHLRQLPKLEELCLMGTKVTDAGLEHLRTMRNLKSITLIQTSATEPGVQKLREALPECEISYWR